MGCGGGSTSIFFAKYGYEVVGQDIAEDMADLARKNQARQNVGNNLSFVASDFESVGIDNSFDAVVFSTACTMQRMNVPPLPVHIAP
jgi:ubiquinone/menaquinone biosynthesis C-methylase UbiE